MSKPKFDPNKPYEVVDEVKTKQPGSKKPRFNPEKPFDIMVDSLSAQDELEKYQEDRYPDLALLAAHGASQDFLDEGAGAIGAMTGGDYKTERNKFRAKIADSRERTGIAGDAAELIGNVGVTMLPGARIASTAGKEIALSALQGAGAADELEDVPGQSLKSAAVSGATQLLGKGVEKLFFNEPDKILARTMGARNNDFLKGRGGVNSPDEVANHLDKLGFFRQGEVVFDPLSKKFIPNPTKSRLENFFKPKSLESLHDRAKIAMTAIKTRKDALLKGKKIPSEDLSKAIDSGLAEFAQGYDVAQRTEIGNALKEQLFEDLASLGHVVKKPQTPHIGPGYNNYSNMVVDAKGLDSYKGYLGDEVHKSFEKRLRDVGLNDEAIMKLRKKMDDVLDLHGGADYADLNDISHKLNLTAEDAWQKIARESATGVEKPTLTRGSIWDRAVDMVNPAAVGVGRARIGKNMDSVPVEAIRKGFKRAPVEILNNNQAPVEVIENDPGHPMSTPQKGRMPQSVPNIPEQFIRTPLPRTTEGLMKNKNFVLGKVAQMMPDMFEAVQDTYEHDPEMLGQIAQVLAMKMPHIFERDKYNRFDGRILSEKDKQMAIKDTLLKNDLSSIEQAKIITRLNKEGLYDG